MSEKKGRRSTNIFLVVQVVFLILKLTGTIDWAWIWVLSPLWIGFAGLVLLLFAVIALAAISYLDD